MKGVVSRGLDRRSNADQLPYRIINTGSPWNVPAGHGSASIDALVQKYQKEAFEENERKLKQLRENKVPVEQALQTSMTKVTPAGIDS